MASLAISAPKLVSLTRLFARRRPTAVERPAAAAEAPDADRARRAFVQEMLERNALAFASEEDVQCMLHFYPGRF